MLNIVQSSHNSNFRNPNQQEFLSSFHFLVTSLARPLSGYIRHVCFPILSHRTRPQEMDDEVQRAITCFRKSLLSNSATDDWIENDHESVVGSMTVLIRDLV
jgi:hypothetical protein